MVRSSARRIALGLAAVCLGMAVPGPTRAADWKQEEVTAIAGQLQQATSELYDAFYRQPTQGIGSGRSRAYLELKQQLRRIRTEARQLASNLEKGEGHDETLPIYRNLMEEVRSAQENARRVYSTSPVIDKANATRELLDRLSSHYDIGE